MFRSIPLVSVIIPTYNRSGYLTNAIESVINQSYKKIEIIVVDDNSSDNTEEIVKSIDFPILYVKQDNNRGGSAARNVGIELAKGDYIAFLDDDDEWLGSKLETQISQLNGYEASLTGYYLKKERWQKIVFGKNEVRLRDILKVNPFSPGSGLLASSDLIKSLRFDESLPNGQDWDFLVEILKKRNIRYVRDALYAVNDGEHDRITNKIIAETEGQIEEGMRAIEKHKSVLGNYFYRYQVAYRYMSYISKQRNRLSRVNQGVRRAGIIPVLHVFLDKVVRKINGPGVMNLFRRSNITILIA